MKTLEVQVVETVYQCEVCLKIYADPTDAAYCENSHEEKASSIVQ